MKSASSAFAAHLAGETTTLAMCWKITRRDSAVLGFTSHSKDIVCESVTYHADTGFSPTAVNASASLAVDSLDVRGMLSSAAITEQDILAGKYDFAEVEVFLLNYADPSQGKLTLHTGWLGEVTLNNGAFVAEVRGLTQPLSQTLGELYSPSCRASLGDSRCGIDMAAWTVTGTLTAVTSRQVFADTTRAEAAGHFTYGAITFTSGANDGLSMEVKEYAVSGQITLTLPMPYAVAIGDAYTLRAGCDKTFETCVSRFNNAVNFRGEPHVPGTDRMLETAGTFSE